MTSLIHFQRTGSSKASLDLGLKSFIHEGLLKFIRIHRNKMGIDIAISQIRINDKKSISIYYDSVDPLYDKIPLNPHEYFSEIFKECNIWDLLEEESYYYDASHENYYRKSREYIIKDEYKNYLTEGMVYPNE